MLDKRSKPWPITFDQRNIIRAKVEEVTYEKAQVKKLRGLKSKFALQIRLEEEERLVAVSGARVNNSFQ